MTTPQRQENVVEKCAIMTSVWIDEDAIRSNPPMNIAPYITGTDARINTILTRFLNALAILTVDRADGQVHAFALRIHENKLTLIVSGNKAQFPTKTTDSLNRWWGVILKVLK
jgi:hypothetical protein